MKRWATIAILGALGLYLAVMIPRTLIDDADDAARCGFTTGPPLCTTDTPIW